MVNAKNKDVIQDIQEKVDIIDCSIPLGCIYCMI